MAQLDGSWVPAGVDFLDGKLHWLPAVDWWVWRPSGDAYNLYCNIIAR